MSGDRIDLLKRIKKLEQENEELKERATPKKAILVHNYDGLVFECPNCHMEFRPDTIINHVKWKGCPYCLLNLDWGEEE